MAEKKPTSRRASDSRSAPSRQAAPSRQTASGRQATTRHSEPERTAPPRRNDVVRCENCEEDYSTTYKRCPFCDERPGRSAIGRSSSGSQRGQVHPIQVIGLVVSLILIIAALFIVFKYMGPLLFGSSSSGDSSSAISSSQSSGSDVSLPSASQPAGSTGDSSVDVPPAIIVSAISLSKQDITLQYQEDFQFIAAVSPAEAQDQIVWTSSHPDILTVDQDGIVKNINGGSETVQATITASCGDRYAECIVRCKGGGTAPSTGTSTPSTGTTTPSGSAVAPNTRATVTGAGNGLNIRSGPGSNHNVIASASNGAEVTILEDLRNGWYKIDYGNGKVGYGSSSYIIPK